jgi:Ser/Thr protein kinase RdoA (MazF antagonist)
MDAARSRQTSRLPGSRASPTLNTETSDGDPRFCSVWRVSFPVPVRTHGGGLWTLATAAGVPEARIGTLLSWVPGRCERRRRTPTILRRMGRLMARLHERAAAYLPPGSFVRPRWDYQGLFGRHGEVLPGWPRLSRRQEDLFRAVGERLRRLTDQWGTGRDVFGLIHGDLIFQNVLFHQGEARAIDFDDCGFGYFVYDLSILLDRIGGPITRLCGRPCWTGIVRYAPCRRNRRPL